MQEWVEEGLSRCAGLTGQGPPHTGPGSWKSPSELSQVGARWPGLHAPHRAVLRCGPPREACDLGRGGPVQLGQGPRGGRATPLPCCTPGSQAPLVKVDLGGPSKGPP